MSNSGYLDDAENGTNTDCSKTYMIYAFDVEAYKHYCNTKYVCRSELLIDLEIARTAGSYIKILEKYVNLLILISDE